METSTNFDASGFAGSSVGFVEGLRRLARLDRRDRLRQIFIALLSSQERLVIPNKFPLCRSKRIVSVACCLDCITAVLCDNADIVDQRFNALRCLLVQNCLIGVFGIYEVFVVVNKLLLCGSKSIIGFAGGVDGAAAVLCDLTDGFNQLFSLHRPLLDRVLPATA